MFKLEYVHVFYGVQQPVDITTSITELLEISEMPSAEEVGKMLHKKAYWNGRHVRKAIKIKHKEALSLDVGHKIIEIEERIIARMSGIYVSWRKVQ